MEEFHFPFFICHFSFVIDEPEVHRSAQNRTPGEAMMLLFYPMLAIEYWPSHSFPMTNDQ